VRVLLSGTSPECRKFADAALRAALSISQGGDQLTVVAHRLTNGRWSLFIFDAQNIEVADPNLIERLVAILSDD
jgi:hypothetical protein